MWLVIWSWEGMLWFGEVCLLVVTVPMGYAMTDGVAWVDLAL